MNTWKSKKGRVNFVDVAAKETAEIVNLSYIFGAFKIKNYYKTLLPSLNEKFEISNQI